MGAGGRLGRGPSSPAPGDRIGPHEVLGQVAQGGMARVLEVRDTRDGSLLAMKLLLPLELEEEARSRFRREFRALSRLQHPNVLRVFEWGIHDDRPWFTMERLEGHTLVEEIEVLQQVPAAERFARARSILVQVANALALIHDHGLVHRDLTPGNVMLTPEGLVKLMDFGVVKDIGRQDLTAVGEVIGTAAYIAPEQIEGGSVDARADLYALGVVLYQLLTGRKPFTAHTLHGYLEKHLHHVPPPPAQIDPLVPPELSTLCSRLLAKDPADRYASASHLLHHLGVDREDSADQWPPRTVGRTRTKTLLRDALEEAVRGREGTGLLLLGRAGQGKTRMLDLAGSYARGRGLRIGRGHCRNQDRPFGAFIGVFNDLATEAAPAVLREVFSGDDPETLFERYAILSAFKRFLVEAAPCVVMIDDLHRADPATLELLGYLVRNTLVLEPAPILYLLTEESSGEPRAVSAQATEGLQRVELPPLSAAEVEEIVLSLLPSQPATLALAQRLHHESNGSPAFIADMLQGMVDEGLLKELQGGATRYRLTLQTSEITASRLPLPPSLMAALRDRLTPLSAHALALARLLALARRSLPVDVLIDTAGLDEDDTLSALDDLEDARMLREQRGTEDERVELAQPRFRDVLLEGLDADALRGQHARLAEVLERYHRSRPGLVVPELAYHFERADIPPKAYAFLVLAAQRALQRSLYDAALDLLDRALRIEPRARVLMLLDQADQQLAEVHLARSHARHHLGRWQEALVDARSAADLAEQVSGAAGLQSRAAAELGTQLERAGDHSSQRWLEQALARADQAHDRTLRPMPLYRLGGLLWARGDLRAAELRWREALQTAIEVGDERAQGWGYNGLAIHAICCGQSMEARRHLEHSARLFERLGMLAPLAITRVNLVETYLALGVLKKALALADRTVSQAQEVHHPQGIVLGMVWRAEVLRAIGRLDEAQSNASEALRLARSLGSREDELVALATSVHIALNQGQPELALSQMAPLLALLPTHDFEGISPLVTAWHAQALAALERVPEALAVLRAGQRPADAWPHVRVRTDLAWSRAWRLLQRPEIARELLEQSLATAAASGFRLYQLVAHLGLAQVAATPADRARHTRLADGLRRSLAANLARSDAKTFTTWRASR